MYKLFDWILKHPVTISVINISVFLLGIICTFLVPVELSPNVDNPVIQIVTYWPNTSAILVESLVTVSMEEKVQEINGIEKVESKTSDGQSTIIVHFSKKVDLQLAEIELNEKIYHLMKQMPDNVKWPQIYHTTPKELKDLEGFMRFVVLSDRDVNEIHDFVTSELYLPFVSVQGVENVEIQGGQEKTLYINIDNQKLTRLNLKISDLNALDEYLDRNSINLGKVTKNNEYITVKVRQDYISLNEIRNIPILKKDNRITHLGDLADIYFKYKEPQSIFRINGQNLVSVSLDKASQVNLFKTSARVDKKVEELKKFLPKDIQIVKELDKSLQFKEELTRLRNRSFFSIVLIAFSLFIVFRRVTVVGIILASIVLSLLGSLFLVYITDTSINVLTLAGFTLGFGILVDNSIVIFDNIHRRLSLLPPHKKSESIIKDTIIESTIEMLKPLIASNITTLAALMAVFFLSSGLKTYFSPFTIALSSTIIFSFFVSLTLIPLHSYKSHKFIVPNKKPVSVFLSVYSTIISFLFKKRVLVFILILMLIGLPIWLLPDNMETDPVQKPFEQRVKIKNKVSYLQFINNRDKFLSKDTGTKKVDEFRQKFAEFYNNTWGNTEFSEKTKPLLFRIFGGSSYLFFKKVPKENIFAIPDRNAVLIFLKMYNNIPIEKIEKVCYDIENMVLKYKDFLNKVSVIIYNNKYAAIKIEINDNYKYSLFPEKIFDELGNFCNNFGGLGISIIGEGPFYSKSLRGKAARFSMDIKGNDFQKVYDIAKYIQSDLSKNNRFQNIDVNNTKSNDLDNYEMVCHFNNDAIINYQFTKSELVSSIAYNLDINIPKTINYNNQYTKVLLTIKDREQVNDVSLEETIIENKEKNKKLRLGSMVELQKQPSQPEIVKVNQVYSRFISFDYIGPSEFGYKFLDKYVTDLQLPYGYTIDVRKENSWNKKEGRELINIILIAIMIIWMIAACLFESWRIPVITIMTIPLSFIGVFYTFYLFNIPFTTGGYAALLLLVGITVNNTFILVNNIYLNKNRNLDFLSRKAYDRIRPIFLTTITTIVGLIPLVVFEDSGSFWYPFAVATIGGLTTSSLLQLIFIPLIMGSVQKKNKESTPANWRMAFKE